METVEIEGKTYERVPNIPGQCCSEDGKRWCHFGTRGTNGCTDGEDGIVFGNRLCRGCILVPVRRLLRTYTKQKTVTVRVYAKDKP